ncbi:MAG: hypothetical protein NTV32_10200 [Gammaproteobacteria bacterium]|nr:hypothetical protein [Gammaproteobacteria bacterium]
MLNSWWFLKVIAGCMAASTAAQEIDRMKRDKLGTAAANMAFRRAEADSRIIARVESQSLPHAVPGQTAVIFKPPMTREELYRAASSMAFARAKLDAEIIAKYSEPG